jgi:small subunit ribosomal protein S4
MIVGPKYKIGKRLGSSVFEKCQTQKFMLSEARSANRVGKRRKSPRSDYGKQFLEKQKVRYTYGVSEKQFKNYKRECLIFLFLFDFYQVKINA